MRPMVCDESRTSLGRTGKSSKDSTVGAAKRGPRPVMLPMANSHAHDLGALDRGEREAMNFVATTSRGSVGSTYRPCTVVSGLNVLGRRLLLPAFFFAPLRACPSPSD